MALKSLALERKEFFWWWWYVRISITCASEIERKSLPRVWNCISARLSHFPSSFHFFVNFSQNRNCRTVQILFSHFALVRMPVGFCPVYTFVASYLFVPIE